MLSNKPYLVRAFYQWIMDSACTPYIVFNANFPRCRVPTDYVENGEITLNISPVAVRDLNITNDIVEFKASFSGVVHLISAPINAVLAIYANENQQGMFFDYEDSLPEGEETASAKGAVIQQAEQSKETAAVKHEEVKSKGKAHLRLVE